MGGVKHSSGRDTIELWIISPLQNVELELQFQRSVIFVPFISTRRGLHYASSEVWGGWINILFSSKSAGH